MIKPFDLYIKESIGVVTVNSEPKSNVNEPDYISPLANIVHTGRSTAAPYHWNNSPFLSGGRYGSGALSFGSNPKFDRNVMSYKDFIKKNNRFTNNLSKSDLEGVYPPDVDGDGDIDANDAQHCSYSDHCDYDMDGVIDDTGEILIKNII